VNLEPALRVGDALGGHFVTGHVDGVGVVKGVRVSGKAREMEVTLPTELLPFLAEKGSVALDGVSLTVARVASTLFRVALVPYTLEETTLGDARAGTRLNVEIDVLARYVGRLLEAGSVGRQRPGRRD
jgi:riboflavin synthase